MKDFLDQLKEGFLKLTKDYIFKFILFGIWGYVFKKSFSLGSLGQTIVFVGSTVIVVLIVMAYSEGT